MCAGHLSPLEEPVTTNTNSDPDRDNHTAPDNTAQPRPSKHMCGIQAAQPRPASEPYLPSNDLSPDHQAPSSNTGGPSVATCPRRKMSGPHKIRKIDIDDTVVEVAKAVPGTSTDPPARSNAPSTAGTNEPDRAADAAVRSWCSAGAQDCGKSQPPRYKTGKFYHLSVSCSVPHCLLFLDRETDSICSH